MRKREEGRAQITRRRYRRPVSSCRRRRLGRELRVQTCSTPARVQGFRLRNNSGRRPILQGSRRLIGTPKHANSARQAPIRGFVRPTVVKRVSYDCHMANHFLWCAALQDSKKRGLGAKDFVSSLKYYDDDLSVVKRRQQSSSR